jgi:hypothetical protein
LQVRIRIRINLKPDPTNKHKAVKSDRFKKKPFCSSNEFLLTIRIQKCTDFSKICFLQC